MYILKYDVRDIVDFIRVVIFKYGVKKVLFGNSVGLVDFVVGLVEFVFYLFDR